MLAAAEALKHWVKLSPYLQPLGCAYEVGPKTMYYFIEVGNVSLDNWKRLIDFTQLWEAVRDICTCVFFVFTWVCINTHM